MAIALFMSSSMNASSNVSFEEEGRASDCVRMARATVMALADFVGDDVNGENFQGYLAIYMDLYTDCLNN